MTKATKFPCKVCLKHTCAAPNCPAATEQGKLVYEKRLLKLLEKEIPADEYEAKMLSNGIEHFVNIDFLVPFEEIETRVIEKLA